MDIRAGDGDGHEARPRTSNHDLKDKSTTSGNRKKGQEREREGEEGKDTPYSTTQAQYA
jgi:hypothetical protein